MNRKTNDQQLTEICKQVFQQLLYEKMRTGSLKKKLLAYSSLKIVAEYYPYTNIKLTARKRKGNLIIRISDILSNAPESILASAATCIISQQLGISVDKTIRTEYRKYIHSHEIAELTRVMRKERATKMIAGAKGKYFDLDNCFNIINQKYFDNNLSKPIITWSSQRSRSRLGHYDADLDTLVLSKNMDKTDTPEYVVEYVLYHELLHKIYPDRFINGRRQIHSPEFKHGEQRFEEFDRAKKWLKMK
jgi:predicted metal-dependent hydrolase